MDQLTDPKEIRKMLTRVSRTGERIDGAQEFHYPSIAANIVRQALILAEINGLNTEDAMTLLAYHALLGHESITDQLMAEAMTAMPRFVMPAPPGS